VNLEFEDNSNEFEEIEEFYDQDTRIYYALKYILLNEDDLETITILEDAFERLNQNETKKYQEFDSIIESVIRHLRDKYNYSDVFKQKFHNEEVINIMLRLEIQYFVDLIDQNGDSPYPEYASNFLIHASKDFQDAIEKADAILMEQEDFLLAHMKNLESES
jgi:hypothetical protein